MRTFFCPVSGISEKQECKIIRFSTFSKLLPSFSHFLKTAYITMMSEITPCPNSFLKSSRTCDLWREKSCFMEADSNSTKRILSRIKILLVRLAIGFPAIFSHELITLASSNFVVKRLELRNSRRASPKLTASFFWFLLLMLFL